MASQRVSTYRAIVREVNRTVSETLVSLQGPWAHPRGQSVSTLATRPKVVFRHVRAIFEDHREEKDGARFYRDMRNAAMFMHSQRIHKVPRHIILLS